MEYKQEIARKIKILNIFHRALFVAFLAGIVSLIFPSFLTLYFSTALLFVAATQIYFKGKCILTVYESDLRRTIGEEIPHNRFASDTAQKYFKVKIPNWLISIVVVGSFLASGVYIAKFLWNIIVIAFK
jgi:hypothetical protein